MKPELTVIISSQSKSKDQTLQKKIITPNKQVLSR